MTYDATSKVRLRATLSRDVRGAGFRELFLPGSRPRARRAVFPNGINNPWNGNALEAYTSITGGNPNLKPEVADESALGVVLSFERLRFSADWYEIDLDSAIAGAPTPQSVVDACFRGAGPRATP